MIGDHKKVILELENHNYKAFSRERKFYNKIFNYIYINKINKYLYSKKMMTILKLILESELYLLKVLHLLTTKAATNEQKKKKIVTKEYKR